MSLPTCVECGIENYGQEKRTCQVPECRWFEDWMCAVGCFPSHVHQRR